MKHFLILFSLMALCSPISAQWNNRYPKVDGYGHHVYLEAFELPVLNSGPTDPAPSPDGRQLAFSAKGWLWVIDLSSGVATQITSGKDIDVRPAWSPDGEYLVFVRDNGADTWIARVNLESGEESMVINSDKMELDPIYSEDGSTLFYASAAEGTFDLWQTDAYLPEGESDSSAIRITDGRSLERLPVISTDGNFLVYLKKQGFSYDNIEMLDLKTDEVRTLVADNFTAQASFSLSSDDRTLVYTWPHINRYELRLIDLERPAVPLVLTESDGLPLTPKFSADGQWIYFTEFNENERAEIKRIHINGGQVQKIDVTDWRWKQPMSRLTINSTLNGESIPVRISITDASGHPVIPENTTIHSEGQNGIIFFYSPGTIELIAPEGGLQVKATYGFETKLFETEITVGAGSNSATIELERIWNPGEHGWYAGDNHFHLNYGGPNRLSPEDLILELKGEAMDFAFPLVANLHNRYLDQDLFGWTNDELPFIQFGQEVRSHFLGHLNLIGTDSLFWPWIWGPSYDVYGRDDRTNAEAVRFARQQNGLAGYVHPVGVPDPFTENGARRVPVELVADCVVGECDMLEVGCLWTDEIGTASLWHEMLNLGLPIPLSAGSDVMSDYYRTMAIGATRLYVKMGEDLNIRRYLEAMKEGASFVTNGPMLDFRVDEQEPGGTISKNKAKANWTLDVHTSVIPESVEIFINGKVVWSKKWKSGRNNDSFKGSIRIPEGGWVTARVSGGESAWPMMDSYPFAETGPVWFGTTGSTDSSVRKEAARKLLVILEAANVRLKTGYNETPIPNLESQFEKARELLTAIVNDLVVE